MRASLLATMVCLGSWVAAPSGAIAQPPPSPSDQELLLRACEMYTTYLHDAAKRTDCERQYRELKGQQPVPFSPPALPGGGGDHFHNNLPPSLVAALQGYSQSDLERLAATLTLQKQGVALGDALGNSSVMMRSGAAQPSVTSPN